MPSYRLPITSIATLLLFAVLASTAAARQRQDFGTLSIQVRPPDAVIFIDGERWTGPEASGPLQVQLSPGPHRVEVRSPGHRPYVAQISIRAGETTPLNVALPEGGPGPSRGEAPAGPPPAPSSGNISEATSSEDGFVFAPDFKVTEIAHATSGLAGAYAGYVFGGQFLVGAGGYVQTNTTNGSRLFYGGPVVEWRMFPENTVGFNLHALVGGGQFYNGHGYFMGHDIDPRTMRNDPRFGNPYGFHDETFFLAEPEAQIVIRFGASARLQAGAGYRATSAHGLNGASGSISVQFGR